MSQFPPAPPAEAPVPNYNLQPQQGNIAAILSLITGILGCIPGVGIIAIILGAFGVKKSNQPNTTGRGLAIAGIIFGVIGLLWTIGVGVTFLKAKSMIAASAPARAVAKQFTIDVAANKVDAAIADCSSSVDQDKIRATVAAAQGWGALTDTTYLSPPLIDEKHAIQVTGFATFSSATKAFTASVAQENGVYKITDFEFADKK